MIDEKKAAKFLQTRLDVSKILDYAQFTPRTGYQYSYTDDEMTGIKFHTGEISLKRDDVINLLPVAIKRQEIAELDESDAFKFATADEKEPLLQQRKKMMAELAILWNEFKVAYLSRHRGDPMCMVFKE